MGQLKENAGVLIDLPGIYALNPLSKDEAVASRFLIEEDFTSVLNIVDASQLARNLHLTIQLMEYGKPVLIGLNMIDVAKSRGMKVNDRSLAEALGIPVVPIIARTGKGCKAISEQMQEKAVVPDFRIDYGDELEHAATYLMDRLPDFRSLNKRWLALQFLEGNEVIRQIPAFMNVKPELEDFCAGVERRLRAANPHTSIKQEMFKKRQQFIDRLMETAVEKTAAEKKTLTEKIDAVVTNKYLGVPIFLVMMYLVFCITFNWLGTPLSDWLDKFFQAR